MPANTELNGIWEDRMRPRGFSVGPARHASFWTGSSGWRRLLGRSAVVALAVLVALPFVASPALAQRSTVDGRTIDEILDNPSQFYGETVRVSGEVGEMLGTRSFTLEDSDLLFDEELPVVASQPLVDSAGQTVEPGVLANRHVWVTGTVHQLNVGAFEDHLGVDLEDAAWQPWRGQPAIIATSVMYAPASPAPLAPRMPPAQGAPGILDFDRFVTIDAITDDPTTYVGQTVLVNGEVEEVNDSTGGAWAFAVEDADLLFDEQILVLGVVPGGASMERGAAGQEAPGVVATDDLDGRFVWVSGTVRQFDIADVEAQLGIDLDDTLFASWEGRPAIVAQSISIAPAYPYPHGPYSGPYDSNRPASPATP